MKRITWDEKTISEQDKERGTRTKIAEVATPYCYLSDVDSQDEASSFCESDEKANVAQDVIARLSEIQQSLEKQRQFTEHRKQHYMREFDRERLRNSVEDDSSNDDDDGQSK